MFRSAASLTAGHMRLVPSRVLGGILEQKNANWPLGIRRRLVMSREKGIPGLGERCGGVSSC